jgi:separase
VLDANAAGEMQLFLYFGHGHGQQYLSAGFDRANNKCAASLLMGCSSGASTPQGLYRSKCAPFSYIEAGCPAAIANLWDVTDKDIDRFSESLLRRWTQAKQRPQCIADAVAGARGDTRLPYLTGAAPVCFGVPVSVIRD